MSTATWLNGIGLDNTLIRRIVQLNQKLDAFTIELRRNIMGEPIEQKTDLSERLLPESKKQSYKISYATLSIILLSFLGGVITTFVVRNATASETITFSTTSLVSFLFGIALSAASTVLAIVAIALGKSSEQVMIERSDRSIRVQNEVFIRTTEVLSRIESSTGVTEKRIEDIISGRAGAISHRIAERLVEDRSISPRSRQSIEEEIKQSFLNEFSVPDTEIMEEARRKRAEARDQYHKFQNSVLLTIANTPSIEVLKIGSGSYGKTGEELVDGLFKVNEVNVAASAFPTIETPDHIGNFGQYLIDISKEISNGTFSWMFLVFDNDLNDDSDYKKLYDQFKALARSELADKIVMLSGDIDSLGQRIINIVTNGGT